MNSPFDAEEKFRVWPIAALALVFVLAAPTFWKEVELDSTAVALGAENQDLWEFYAPVYENVYGALRAGRLPQWDGSRLCGAPVLGDPRTALFQPLNLIFLLAPFPEAFAIHAFTCLAASGIAFVLFARYLGLSTTAALFGALCFAFSGAAAGAMSRPPLATALACLPVVLWSAGAMARRPRVETVVFLGIALSGLLLSGALAVFIATAGVASAYVFTTAIASPVKGASGLSRAFGGLALAFLICACVCAVYYAPIVDLALRLENPADIARLVFPAGTLPGSLREAAAQIVAPQSAGLPILVNFGVVGLFLVPAALFRRRLFVDGAFFLVTASVLIAVAVLYAGRFPDALPPYSIVYPAMACASAACALGADRIIRKRVGPGRETYWFASGLVICACFVVFLFGNSMTRGYATIAVAIVVAMLFARRTWIRAGFGLALCGLAWVNLLTTSTNTFAHPFDQRRSASSSAIAEWQNVPELERGRLAVAGDSIATAEAIGIAVPRIDGYGALLTRDQATWWRALTGEEAPDGSLSAIPNSKLLGAMGGNNLLAAFDSEDRVQGLRWSEGDDGPRFGVNDFAVPRAYWVGRLEWVDDVEHAIERIQSEESLRNLAFVESRYDAIPELQELVDSESGGGATASLQERTPEHIVVSVNAPANGLLVLADTFAPHWSATLDGQPADIVQANGIFRAVPVPEGEHIVEFRYRNVPALAGGVVSIVSLVSLVLWALIRLIR